MFTELWGEAIMARLGEKKTLGEWSKEEVF